METEMMMVIGACSIPCKLSHLVLNIAEQLIGAREDDEKNISFWSVYKKRSYKAKTRLSKNL
ncbi:hypothetical protein YC2023_076105 [Brassica napus]